MNRIYVAGPYTRGDVAVNVRAAMDAADRLIARGFAPFVPHLSHFLHMLNPRPYEDWIAVDLAWVEVCDALLRLPGVSPGAEREVAHATMLTIPVYNSIEEIPS